MKDDLMFKMGIFCQDKKKKRFDNSRDVLSNPKKLTEALN